MERRNASIILILILLITASKLTKGQDTIAQLLDIIEPNCTYLNGNSITLTTTGGSTGSNETTQYLLTNHEGTILAFSTTPTFNGLSTGGYIAYAVSYLTTQGINQLSIGNNIQNINSNNSCFDFSLPYPFTVCPAPSTCDKYTGSNITVNATGGNTVNGTTQYILADSTGKILQIQNNTTFLPLGHAGNYFAYALSYANTTTVGNLSQGNALSDVTFSDTCYDWSAPYIFQVCDNLVEICNDGIDNDGDGLVDCGDPDCGQPSISQVVPFDPTIPSCPNLDNGSIVDLVTTARPMLMQP